MRETTVDEIAEHYLSTGRVRKGDVSFLLGEIDRRIPWPPDDATVEKCARAVYDRDRHAASWEDAGEFHQEDCQDAARAVLDALGDKP